MKFNSTVACRVSVRETCKINSHTGNLEAYLTNKRMSPAFSTSVIEKLRKGFDSNDVTVEIGSSESIKDQKPENIAQVRDLF